MKSKTNNEIVEQKSPEEVFKASVIRISDAVAAWDKAGMKRRPLMLLLSDTSGVGKADVCRVLNSIENLKADLFK